MTLWRGIADFHQPWRITREIEDRKAGAKVSFEGKVMTEMVSGQLRWHETGQLRMPQGAFASDRVTLWQDVEAGLAVHFDDGRLFHRIDRAVSPIATHDCDPDVYNLAYDFAPWPRWSVTITVSGPRKDYTSVTLYSPKEIG